MTILQEDKSFQQAMSPLSSVAGSWGNAMLKPESPQGRSGTKNNRNQLYQGVMAPTAKRDILRKEMLRPNAVGEPNDIKQLLIEIAVSSYIEYWRHTIAYTSSIKKMTAEPAYRRIVSIGEAAVPTLLREIERQPDFLVLALKEITGADPVLVEHRGNVRKMANDWIKWGMDRYGK